MTRDEAIKEAEGKQVVMRSCWQCNGAHEHLKSADYVVYCVLGCGRLYWKGVEIHRTEFDGCHDNDQVRLSDTVDVKVTLSVPSIAPSAYVMVDHDYDAHSNPVDKAAWASVKTTIPGLCAPRPGVSQDWLTFLDAELERLEANEPEDK